MRSSQAMFSHAMLICAFGICSLLTTNVLAADADYDSTFGTAAQPGRNTAAFDEVLPGADQAQAVLRDATGAFILTGQISDTEGSHRKLGIARFLANGAIDTSFGSNGRVVPTLPLNLIPVAAARATNGSATTFVAGSVAATAGVGRRMVVCRLTSGYVPDTSFASTGCQIAGFDAPANADDLAAKVIVDSSNASYVIGRVHASGNTSGIVTAAVAKLASNGQFDTQFSLFGRFLDDVDPTNSSFANSAVLASTGNQLKIVGTKLNLGQSTLKMWQIDRTAGTYDSSFCPHSGACPDSEVFAGQRTYTPNGYSVRSVPAIRNTADGGSVILLNLSLASAPIPPSHFALLKLRADGSVDPGFGSNGISIFSFGSAPVASDLQRDASGQWLISGSVSITASSGVPEPAGRYAFVARAFGNGRADQQFNVDRAFKLLEFRRSSSFTEIRGGAAALVIDNNQPVVAGFSSWNLTPGATDYDNDYTVTRLLPNSNLLNDGFE